MTLPYPTLNEATALELGFPSPTRKASSLDHLCAHLCWSHTLPGILTCEEQDRDIYSENKAGGGANNTRSSSVACFHVLFLHVGELDPFGYSQALLVF